MTREDSWQASAPVLEMLRQITALGYVVSVHRIPSSLLGSTGAFVEMQAIDLRTDPPTQQICRVGCDEGADADHRCAQLVAEAVGPEA